MRYGYTNQNDWAVAVRQWVITVGINHYQHLQPLSYARQDAEAVGQCLMTQAGVPPDRVILLAETAPGLDQQSTWPSRLTLQTWLDHLTRDSIHSGDALWFFFSGYGLCDQGQDYLMPIDGHPRDCRRTALPMGLVFQALQQSAADQVLVLLDMSRPIGAGSPQVGAQTAFLAEQSGIPTILSCQPGQVSQATVALQQGLFTRSLLEALQTDREITPAYLERFLRDRLPALCGLYGRSFQQVLMICPPDRLEQPVLLKLARSTPPQATPIPWPASGAVPAVSTSIQMPTPPKIPEGVQECPQPAVSPPSQPGKPTEPLISLSPEGWHWFKLGVGVLAALIFSGLLISHLRSSDSHIPSATEAKIPDQASGLSTTLRPNQPMASYSSVLGPAQARTLIKSNQASPFWEAIQQARKITPPHPEYPLMPQAIAGWSQDIWTIAQQRAVQGEFDTAILAAALVPPDQPAQQQARASMGRWCSLFRFNPQRNIDQQRQAAALCRTLPALP